MKVGDRVIAREAATAEEHIRGRESEMPRIRLGSLFPVPQGTLGTVILEDNHDS